MEERFERVWRVKGVIAFQLSVTSIRDLWGPNFGGLAQAQNAPPLACML